MRLRSRASRFAPLYATSFFLALHSAILIYINSSYLKLVSSEGAVGFIYAVGALANLLLLLNAHSIIRRIGIWNLLVSLIGLEAFAMAGLAFGTGAWVVVAFMLHLSSSHMIAYCLDIYLEHASVDKLTGQIRTSYLTLINLMIALSPIITGAVVGAGAYRKAYLISLSFLVPAMLIVSLLFKHLKSKPPRHELSHAAVVRSFLRRADLRLIFSSALILSFFYSWMVIYMPMYLHENVGLSWDRIGIVFSVMLLPFVLFEIPAGRLADRKYGEKEMLSLGFVIMSLFTFLIPFVPAGASIALWAGILFMTRVGAALVEAMTESFFFKHVDATEEDYIAFYRTAQPLSYILGPLTATLALAFVPFQAVFIILACVVMLGLRYSLALRDTK